MNEKEFNYGVLCSFQPDYLRDMQETPRAQPVAAEDSKESPFWQSFASEAGAFFSKS